MNRTEGRTVDRAENKGPEKVYDYGTGKKPISGDTAVPDSGEEPGEPADPEEEPYETADTPEKQASPDGVTTDPQPGDRSHCYKTDSADIEMCQSRTYSAEMKRAAKALAAPAKPLVPWCDDPAIGGYTLTRDEGCHKIGVVVQWWRISTNQAARAHRHRHVPRPRRDEAEHEGNEGRRVAPAEHHRSAVHRRRARHRVARLLGHQLRW